MQTNGWIIYNGSLPGDKFLDFAEWLCTAVQKAGSNARIIKNNDLLVSLTTAKLDILTTVAEPLPDYVIFTDKDIYLAKQLELLGVPVFNSAEAIAISDDKIATHQYLAIAGLPMPDTIVAPKVFTHKNMLDDATIQLAINKLGFPMVIKEAFGSFGEQVYLVENEVELQAKVNEIGGKPFIFQQFIDSSFGRDLRLHVVGDKVVAAMKRTAPSDFRANVTAGGKMQAYQPTDTEEKLAVAASKAIGADFSGVDILFGPNDTRLVCEVNSNAHIHNMYDCTNINVADFIATYVLQTIKNARSEN